jgi:hypothetical protein
MHELRAEIARLQALVAVKDQMLISKETQLTAQGELLASQAEETKLLKRELQLHAASSDAGGHMDGNAKRQHLHDRSRLNQQAGPLASPLDIDDVLDQIFSYVGGGEHFYIAGVSRRWRGRYLRPCVLNSTSELDKNFVTRHRSVLMTEKRLYLAFSSGLSVEGWAISTQQKAEMICKHSLEPVQVMTVLRLHGVPWDQMLCNSAAFNAKLSLLQWLRINFCPWSESDVLLNASRYGSVAMMEWLLTATAAWTVDIKLCMLIRAAWCNNTDVAKWLRARGAQWPEKFAGQFNAAGGATVHQCWSLSALQWAIAAGSGWLDWHCEDYTASHFDTFVAKQARDVLEWAHANGCPCTCGQRQRQQQ